MARPQSALTTYILSLPVDMPVKEVIEKAREKGYETGESNVSRVRQLAAKAARASAGPSEKETPERSTTGAVVTPAAPKAPGAQASPTLKSDFIRNQPLDLAPGVVVAMAKAQGLAISESLVRKVRGPQGKGPATRAAKAGGKVTSSRSNTPEKPRAQVAKPPEASSKSRPSSLSKSEFVRTLPLTMSPADAVIAGKAKGLTFSRNLVYLVRARMTGPGSASKATSPKKSPAIPKIATPKKTPPKPRASRRVPTRATPVQKTAPTIPETTSKRPIATVAVSTPAPRPVTSSPSLEGLLRAVASELGLGRAVEILEGERARVRTLLGD